MTSSGNVAQKAANKEINNPKLGQIFFHFEKEDSKLEKVVSKQLGYESILGNLGHPMVQVIPKSYCSQHQVLKQVRN